MAEDIRVTAFLHAAPGQEDAVRDAALACIAPTRGEPGCAMYILHRDSKNPALFVFIEHWASQQALDQHMQTPHLKTLARALEGKLAKPLDVNILQPLTE